MRGFFAALAFLLFAVTAFAQTPTISPSAPTAFKNGTINFTCTSNCGTGGTWSCSRCAGSINPSTGVYTAPAVIKAQQQLAGYQLLPNNAVFNVDISGLPASPITGATGNFNITDSFPLNYITNSTPTDNMVFFYTPDHNGTYFAPSQNNFLSANIEGGWYQARNQFPGNTDHHFLKANSDTGAYEEQYHYYPVGDDTFQGCPTCNSQSGVKYTSTSYSAPDITSDAAGLYIMPLILRRQEFDKACNGGTGSGSINHALRLTLPAGYINRGFIWPAQTFSSGSGTHSYGERFRLKSSFNETGFSPCARIILEELKHYGLFVADIGFNWQANIEYTSWSEADEGYIAEINNAKIADTNFEQVDESSLEISPTSLEANTHRETVAFTSSTGTVTAEVVLLGITVGTLQDAVDIMASSPGIQLKAVIQGDTTINWSLSSAVGSITPSGVYTPPATASSETTIRAIATSNADNTISADTLIRIWPGGAAYALPSWPAGNDYTDSHGHVWKSGAGIGITNQHGQLGCCSADHVGQYTGPATDHQLWDHLFTGSLNNEADYHIYWFVPAGTYTLTFHSMAPAPAGAGTNGVNFIAQGSTLASNVDFAAGVGQYGPYTRTDFLTVGCDNLLTYDEQMHDDGGFAQISSFSITQNTNTQASCSPASSAYDQAILADSPVAFWNLNPIAATETDLTGNGNTGTYQGGSPTTGTLPNGEPVAVFNGSNQYVSVPSNASLSIPTTGNLTWEMWIQPTVLNFPNSIQPDGYVNVIGKCASHPNTGLCEWLARMYDTTTSQSRCNRLNASVFNPNGGSGSAADWQPVCGLIQAGEWLHVVGEYTTDPSKTPTDCTNGSTYPGAINIWVNGVLWDQAAHGQTGCMGQSNIVPQATSSQFNIGTVDTQSWFQGAIGKVAIYNHLLTQTQITNHYQTMTGKQPTGTCGATCTF
jgi:hypothetical protein